MQYRREIDGLRALAVIPVIFFHAGFSTFSGGYVGVDVFFVISGYLITSLILAEKQAGTFSLMRFYERRARRILPALFLVMFACLPFAWLWLLPGDLNNFSESLVAVSVFSSNLLFYLKSGYFATAAELKPLLHTWSLAVEEQYYVLFPIFLLLTWRLGKRWIIALLASVAIISLAAAQWGSLTHPAFTFFLLPTRGWEILVGAFVAFYLFKHDKSHIINENLAQAFGVIGLLLIAYAVFAFDKETPFPSFYALIPTIGTALIILYATEQTFVGRLLGSKPLVGIGLISYSAYLWHQPIFAFARQRSYNEPSKLLLVALALAAIVLAFLSWKYVETPFRNRRRIKRSYVFVFGALCSALFVGIGLVGHLTKGFVGRLSPSQREILSYGTYDIKTLYREHVCFLDPEQGYTEFSDQCKGINPTSASALIWGDSFAAALSVGLRQLLPSVIQYTASGCPPIKDAVISWRPQCKSINDFVMKEIQRIQPQSIFLDANWLLYNKQKPTTSITGTIDYIHTVSPLSKITVVGPAPQWLPSLPVFMLKRHIGIGKPIYLQLQTSVFGDLISIDKKFDVVAKNDRVEFYSPLEGLCEDSRCLAVTTFRNRLTLTAWDYGHLTEGGSLVLAGKLLATAASER